MLRLITAVALILVGFCTPVYAKIVYVDGASGNDSVSYADNGPEQPWRTIGRAAWGSINRSSPNPAQAVQPGDTVVVRAGTYATAGTGDRWGVAYHTANSGTPTSPIIFQADGLVILTLSSSRGPLIGANGFEGRRDYITWRGFSIYEANAPSTSDTGPAVLAGTVGSTIEDCVLDGNGDPGFGDNHPGVRINWSENVLVRNCLISNFKTSGVNAANGAGIQVYNSGNVVIEHNEIFNSGSGIFLKAPGADPNARLAQFTIRNNYVHDIDTKGIAIHRSPNTPDEPVLIYQNIIRDASMGMEIWAFDGGDTDPRNVKFVNNTIQNVGQGISISNNLVSNAGHSITNNIVANVDSYAINFGGDIANLVRSRVAFDHNLYSDYSRFAIVHTTEHSFPSWRSNFSQDVIAPASQDSNPMFVDPPDGNLRLQTSSPAIDAGVDVLDLNRNGSTTDTINIGAYISGEEVIGRFPGIQSPPPAPPTDIEVD